MTFREFVELTKKDNFAVTRMGSCRSYLMKLLFNFDIKFMFWLRFCQYLVSKPLKCFGLYYFALLVYRHMSYKTGIQIPVATKIGGGLCIMHFGSIIVNSSSPLGEDVVLVSDITIGSVRTANGSLVPKIGNRVVIGAGAKIIGGVEIGNNCMIGAGSVVVKSVPDNSVVVGNPGRVVNNRGKEVVSLYLGPEICEEKNKD